MTSVPCIALDLSYLRLQAGGAMNYAGSMLRTMPPDTRRRALAVVPGAAAADLDLPPDLRVETVPEPFRGRLDALRLLRLPGPDVVHWTGNFMLPGRRLPSIVTVHDFMSEHYRDQGFAVSRGRRLQGHLVDHSVRRADVVITHDELHRRLVLDRRPQGRVVLAPLGPGPWVSTTAGALPGAAASRGPYVLVMGADQPHKRIARFVRALLADPACAGLAVVHTAAALELDHPRLVELGRVDAPELAALMEGARALVMPSSYEGFGMPILEAGIFGVPVVTTPGCPAAVAASRLTTVLTGDEPEDLPSLVAQVASSSTPRRGSEEREQIFRECWRTYHDAHLEAARAALG